MPLNAASCGGKTRKHSDARWFSVRRFFVINGVVALQHLKLPRLIYEAGVTDKFEKKSFINDNAGGDPFCNNNP